MTSQYEDRKKELLTLRPEATASICRSYIQHKMYAQDPVRKFYTIGPMFRRERPQKGRYTNSTKSTQKFSVWPRRMRMWS